MAGSHHVRQRQQRRHSASSSPTGSANGSDDVDGGQGEAVRVPQADGTLVSAVTWCCRHWDGASEPSTFPTALGTSTGASATSGAQVDEVRRVRDDIDRRVEAIAEHSEETPSKPAGSAGVGLGSDADAVPSRAPGDAPRTPRARRSSG